MVLVVGGWVLKDQLLTQPALYLCALIEESVPHSEQDVADQTFHEDHQEPVEGDEGMIDAVLLEVGRQARHLLSKKVTEHPLISLQGTKSSA